MCLNTQETLDKKDFLKNKLKKVFHVFLYVLFSSGMSILKALIINHWKTELKKKNFTFKCLSNHYTLHSFSYVIRDS